MKSLIKGFEFAIEHNLSIKEMEMLLSFIEKPKSTTELANSKNAKLSTIHAIVTRLKLKGLIEEIESEGKFKIFQIKFN